MVKSDSLKSKTIFGCIYPIDIEDEFLNRIKDLSDDEAYTIYENYLDQKQKQDCYFAKPLIYEQSTTKKLSAKYALTENIPTIFPAKTHLPFGYNQNLKDEITNWSVCLYAIKNDNCVPYKEVSYDDFCSTVNISNYPKFDENHVILTFDKEMKTKFEKLESKKIALAKETLVSWLEDIRELGCKPYKVEYTSSFIDEDNIKCYIFKYKKSMFSKWWLGIVSDSGTFSEMKEYRMDTEIEDAKRILNLLKNFWKKSAENLKTK